MNAVHDKVQLFSKMALRFIMKHVPVNDVLEKGPDQHTEQKQSCDRQDRQFVFQKRDVKHVADHRQVEDQRRNWMHMGEELHEIALEHSNAFVPVRDVRPRHNFKDYLIPR